MKILVVSYSFTGNNDALAGSLAAALGADHMRIREAKSRNNGTIAADMLFGRMPELTSPAGDPPACDAMLLVAPVWMGRLASPMRTFLRRLKGRVSRFAFAGISGGALGPNRGLRKELTRRLGCEPEAVFDLLIADLLPPGTKPKTSDTSVYRVTADDIARLNKSVLTGLKGWTDR